jgi:hypothetical protein
MTALSRYSGAAPDRVRHTQSRRSALIAPTWARQKPNAIRRVPSCGAPALPLLPAGHSVTRAPVAVPASVPRLRAAWPEVAVPSTWWPERSKASDTARSIVVIPAPATPTTSSAPRPEVQMPTTAARCSSDSRAPMDCSAPATATSTFSGEATGPSVRPNWRARLSAMAASRPDQGT